MKKILGLAAIALFMVSCSGDDSESTNPAENAPILLKHGTIESDGNIIFFDIEYIGNRMIKLEYTSNSDQTYYSTQTYNYTGNALTSINTDLSTGYNYKLLIEYFANGMMKKNTIVDHTGEVWRNELSYPDNYSFIETSYVNHPDPSVNMYTIQNGNIIKEENPGRRFEYEYDTKNAPKKNVEFADIFSVIRFDNGGEYGNNNRTKRTLYVENEIYDTYTYEYTYDANNYPLTKKTYYNGEYLSTITYSYE